MADEQTTEQVETGDTSTSPDTGPATLADRRKAISDEISSIVEQEGQDSEGVATPESTEEVVEAESNESADTSTEPEVVEEVIEEPFTPIEVVFDDDTTVAIESQEDLIERIKASENTRAYNRTATEKHEEANKLLREATELRQTLENQRVEFETIRAEHEKQKRDNEIVSLQAMPEPPDADLKLEDPDKYNQAYTAYEQRKSDWVKRLVDTVQAPTAPPVADARTTEQKGQVDQDACSKAEIAWWDNQVFPSEEVAETVKAQAQADFEGFHKEIIDDGGIFNPRDMRSLLNGAKSKVEKELGLDIANPAKVAEATKKTVIRQLTQTSKEAPKSAPPSGGGPDGELTNPFSDDVSVDDFKKAMKAQTANGGKLDIRTLMQT